MTTVLRVNFAASAKNKVFWMAIVLNKIIDNLDFFRKRETAQVSLSKTGSIIIEEIVSPNRTDF
jgi:hypothetical protein